MNILKKVLLWIAVVLLGLITLAALLNKAASATILFLLCTVSCIPNIQFIINQKVKIKSYIKVLATVVVFFIGISMMPSNSDRAEETNAVAEQQTVYENPTEEETVTEKDSTQDTDAVMIKCGDQSMLIDAGDDSKGTMIQHYLQKQGKRSIVGTSKKLAAPMSGTFLL